MDPYGLRLGIITDWKSRWYSDKDYASQVIEDAAIRKALHDELTRGAVSRVEIERIGEKKVQIDIHTARIASSRSTSSRSRIPRRTPNCWPAASPTSSRAGFRSGVP